MARCIAEPFNRGRHGEMVDGYTCGQSKGGSGTVCRGALCRISRTRLKAKQVHVGRGVATLCV